MGNLMEVFSQLRVIFLDNSSLYQVDKKKNTTPFPTHPRKSNHPGRGVYRNKGQELGQSLTFMQPSQLSTTCDQPPVMNSLCEK